MGLYRFVTEAESGLEVGWALRGEEMDTTDIDQLFEKFGCEDAGRGGEWG